MDVTALLEALDEYARDYITYVLSITSRTAFRRQRKIVEKRLVAFSLISVVLGVYLYQLFSSTQPINQGTLLSTAFGEYAVWMFMAVVVYFGLRRYGVAAPGPKAEHAPAAPPGAEHPAAQAAFDFQSALWIILRVLPVAYLVASYLAVLASEAGKFVMRDGCSPWAGLPAFVIAESIAILAFLPVAIHGYAPAATTTRIWVVTLLITALLLAAQALSLMSYLRDTAAALYDKPENQEALATAESYIDPTKFSAIQAHCANSPSAANSASAGSAEAASTASSAVGAVRDQSVTCERERIIHALERVNWEGIEACFVQ